MTADERLLPLAPDLAAAPVFAIRKSWVDTEAGIGMVQIHYAWTPSGEQPDWEAAEETILQPHPDLPGLRSAVLEVPRFVNGSPTYALHHFFFVIRGTDRITSPIFTEDIVAREISYDDPVGDYTSVGVAWQAVEDSAGLSVPNYTAATMDGLSFETLGADAPAKPAAIYEFVRAQLLPHVFRALVWGVKGSQVRYVFNLLRSGSPNPADDGGHWADNGGAGWTVEL